MIMVLSRKQQNWSRTECSGSINWTIALLQIYAPLWPPRAEARTWPRSPKCIPTHAIVAGVVRNAWCEESVNSQFPINQSSSSFNPLHFPSALFKEHKQSVVLFVAHDNMAAAKVYDRVGFQGLCGKPRGAGVDPWLEIGFEDTTLGHWWSSIKLAGKRRVSK